MGSSDKNMFLLFLKIGIKTGVSVILTLGAINK